MEIYTGKVLHSGIAVGKIRFLGSPDKAPDHQTTEDAEAEKKRLREAVDTARSQLSDLCRLSAGKAGKENAAIFEAQQLLLRDSSYSGRILDLIDRQHASAEYAVYLAGDYFAEMFRRMEDEVMSSRAADIRDISRRLIHILTGQTLPAGADGPAIIVALDLLPSETMQISRKSILAFVTLQGSPLSHTAILARGMDIPALSGIPVDPSWDGHRAVVDAGEGRLVLDPDTKTLSLAMKKKAEDLEVRRRYSSLIGKDSVTSDGKFIHLFANIGQIGDIGPALENDAEGIGLFRTEFLYMGRRSLPDEEEQFQTYRKALSLMKGKPVTIRTIDLGSDKQSMSLGLRSEKNPALGFRGIRVCLAYPDLFTAQLRAIFRAAVCGDLFVMFPMITSVREVREIKKLIRSVQNELSANDIPFRACPIGIMIETPSSVLLSDKLAQEVDFFSIGTNDLTQYTLAMDRQNGDLDPFYDPYSEAVMEEIRMTVDAGHRHGCRVGICGELGADASQTDRLLKMGVDELSVSPHMILPIRKAIRESSTEPGT